MQVRSHRLHRSCFSSTWLFVRDSPPLTMLHIGLHSHWSSDPGNATIRLDLACPTCKHHYEGPARHWSLPFLDYQILIAKHDHIYIINVINIYIYYIYMGKYTLSMLYIYINIYIWVNYTDLTATSLESWIVREIIPKWPNYSG